MARGRVQVVERLAYLQNRLQSAALVNGHLSYIIVSFRASTTHCDECKQMVQSLRPYIARD